MELEKLDTDDIFILTLYKSIYAVTGIDEKIKILIETIGSRIKCSTVCVFEYNETGDYLKHTYSWSDENSTIDLASRIQINELSWAEITNNSDILLSEDIETLPSSARDIFQYSGIKSVAVLKCFNGEKFLGVVCFAEGGNKRKWTESEIALLHVLKDMVTPLLALKNPEKSNELYRDAALGIINNFGSGVFVTDLETYDILFVNDSFVQMWGIPPIEKTLGKKCWEVFKTNQTGPCASCPIKIVKQRYGLVPGKIVKGEIMNQSNGQWFYCENSFFTWGDGRLVHMGCINEYYESMRLEDGWENYASLDEHTGVYNRDWGLRILDTERIRAKNEGLPFSVCFIKVEGVKQIKEAFGDESANDTINDVLDRIKNSIRASDVIFRWEEDMFLVLFRICGLAYSQGIIAKINTSVEELNDQKGFALSLNIGLQEILRDNNLSSEEIIAIVGRKMHADRFNKMKEKTNGRLGAL